MFPRCAFFRLGKNAHRFLHFSEKLAFFYRKKTLQQPTDDDFVPFFYKRCIFVFHERSDADKTEGVCQRTTGGIGAANAAPMPKNHSLKAKIGRNG